MARGAAPDRPARARLANAPADPARAPGRRNDQGYLLRVVRELAEDGIPVTVTCRVLKLARQPFNRWLEQPVTDGEIEEAYRAG